MRQVLIVEDIDSMRELLKLTVEGIPGFRVSGMAMSTLEARIELDRRRPDLVLLDEILPGESSSELLEELVREGIPVILLTSMENPTHALPPGARARAFKPTWETLKEDQARFALLLGAGQAFR